jgi:hypothetical protein
MKRLVVMVSLLWGVVVVTAQDDWEWERQVSNVKAKISLLENGETWVIVPDDNANMRYISRQLPEEYKKDGLAITFNGWIGKIPPHIRMLGTPLKLTKVWVNCADKKKYKLKKCNYSFKQ